MIQQDIVELGFPLVDLQSCEVMGVVIDIPCYTYMLRICYEIRLS